MNRVCAAALRLAAPALLLAAVSCSLDAAPTTPAGADLDQAAPTVVYAFRGAPAPAGKAADRDGRSWWWQDSAIDPGPSGPWTDSRLIGPRGGTLKIQDWGRRRSAEGQRLQEQLAVEFSVPRGALPSPQALTMTVTGYWLSELEVAFQPSGLRFDREARLRIHLGRDRVDVDTATLRAFHWDNGTETVEVAIEVQAQGNGDVVIQVRVPGFSRYSLGE